MSGATMSEGVGAYLLYTGWLGFLKNCYFNETESRVNKRLEPVYCLKYSSTINLQIVFF